ncbi:hypothetical protein ES708_23760 [subsurface metagenome]
MIPGKKYSPRTRTSRRPTPEKFVHLRKWIEPTEQNIALTSIEEITNINQQLELSSKLFVSNIISRVIAQLIGAYGDGFVTLQATEDGHLKVNIPDEVPVTMDPVALAAGTEEIGSVGLLAGTEEIGKLAAGEELIGHVKLAGAIQPITSKKISFSSTVAQEIVEGVALKKIKLTSLMFTVGGDTDITLQDGVDDLTGPMAFGGDNEPRGMVDNHGYLPYEIATGRSFFIKCSAAVQISGYLTGYIE